MDRKEYMKAYRKAYYQANKERLDKINGTWARNNPQRKKVINDRYLDKGDNRAIANSRNAEWNRSHPESRLAAVKKWSAKNVEKLRTAKNAWNAKNREKARLRTIEWNKKNPEKRKLAAKEYREKNTAKIRTYHVMRRAAHDMAKPKWANEFFIEEIYDLAKRRTKVLGYPWHVDHIVPIQSPIVCGLHVEHNLRVITWMENQRKGNRHWPDMP